MPGAVNARLYHEQVRNLFSSGSASSTTSPLFFMERMATSTQQLLIEQTKSNDTIVKRLDLHTKLLSKLTKNTSDSLGLTDLIMARYLPGIFAKILGWGGAIGGAVAGLLGVGRARALLGKGVDILQKGFRLLFSKTGTAVVGKVSQFLQTGMRILSNVAKPFTNLVSKLGSILHAGGLIKTTTAVAGKLTKFAGLIGRGIGKLAWPLMALMAAIDGVSGFMSADKVLGKNGRVNLYRKIQYAQSSIINGLLLGIPDYISKKLTDKTFGVLLDDAVVSVGNRVSDFGKRMANNIRTALDKAMLSSRTKMDEIRNRMPTREDWKNFGTEIREAVFGLGGYIKSGMLNLFDDIKGWFSDLFSWRPWSTTPLPNGNQSLPGKSLPGGLRPPPSIQLKPQSIAPGRGPRRNSTPQINIPSGLPMRPINLTPNNNIPLVKSILRSSAPAVEANLQMQPSYIQDIVYTGASALVTVGSAAVQSQVQVSQATTEETGETLGDRLARSSAETFRDVLSSDKAMTQMFGAMSDKAEKTMAGFLKNIFTEGLPTIYDIMMGNAASGAGGGYASLGPGGFTPPDPTNYGYSSVSSPLPQSQTPATSPRPSWWDQTMIGPQRPGPHIGNIPPEAYTKPGDAALSSSQSIGSQMMNDMIRHGASPKLAGAIIGNMYQENGKRDQFATKQLGDNGSAVGNMQWRGSRRTNLMKFAAERGLDPYDRTTQAMFAVEETNPNSPYKDSGSVKAAQRINSDPNMSVGEAARVFSELAERPNPAFANNGVRMEAAERYFREHQAGVSTATPRSAYNNTVDPKYRSPMPGIDINDPKQVPFSGGRVNSRSFGGRRGSNKLHTGVDIPASVGTPVTAVMDGVIRSVRTQKGGYGNIVDIEYPDGTVHRNAHLASFGDIKAGQAVKAGTVLGTVGYSGNASADFPHNHYEVIRKQYYDAFKGRPPGRETSTSSLNAGRIDPRQWYKDNNLPLNAADKRKLSDSPLFRSMDKAPRVRQPSATSSNRFGPLRNGNIDVLQSRARTDDLVRSMGVGRYDNLLGRSNVLSTPLNTNNISMVPPERPRHPPNPKVTTPTSVSQAKQPMSPSDPNVKPASTPMPSIETIPVLDELKMLSANSEMLN